MRSPRTWPRRRGRRTVSPQHHPTMPDLAWRQRMAERAVQCAGASRNAAGICFWPETRRYRVGCLRHRRPRRSTSRSACWTWPNRRKGGSSPRRSRGTAAASCRVRGLAATHAAILPHAACPEHRRMGGDAVVTDDRLARPLADQGHRRIIAAYRRHGLRCAAVDSRRYRGEGAGVSSGPSLGARRVGRQRCR